MDWCDRVLDEATVGLLVNHLRKVFLGVGLTPLDFVGHVLRGDGSPC